MRSLGIVGGLGPLASAAFLDTIYRLNLSGAEQNSPVCILYSDPTFPDRTEAVLGTGTELLARRLEAALRTLAAMGADRLVIACVTIHHVLPRLPAELRERVISLVDVALDEVLHAPRPLLLLTTSGTRAAGIFERHEWWSRVQPWLVHLGEADQAEFHRWIYRAKANGPLDEWASWLDALLPRYDAEGFLFGCTELHILNREFERRTGHFDSRAVDPLVIIARDLPELLAGRNGDRAAAARTGLDADQASF